MNADENEFKLAGGDGEGRWGLHLLRLRLAPGCRRPLPVGATDWRRRRGSSTVGFCLPKKNWPRMDADENDLASALASLARLVRRRRRPPAPPVLEFKLAGGDGEGGAGGSIDPDYDWRLGA